MHFKVPRLYKVAAKVAHSVKEENANLDELVERYKKMTPSKPLAALVTKTLSNERILNRIIKKSKILAKENDAEPWLFRVLIAELLLGKQRLPVGNKAIQTVLAYGPVLRTEFMKAKRRQDNKSETEEDIADTMDSTSTQNEGSALPSDQHQDQDKKKHKKKSKNSDGTAELLTTERRQDINSETEDEEGRLGGKKHKKSNHFDIKQQDINSETVEEEDRLGKKKHKKKSNHFDIKQQMKKQMGVKKQHFKKPKKQNIKKGQFR